MLFFLSWHFAMDFQKIPIFNDEEFNVYIKDFNVKHSSSFCFDSISCEDKKLLFTRLESILLNSLSESDIVFDCLNAVRILSRDKIYLDILLSNDLVERLFSIVDTKYHQNATEALKCLCNCIFNSTKAQKCVSDLNFVCPQFLKRLRNYETYPLEFKNFDIQLQFLITALCAEKRSMMLVAIPDLTKILNLNRNSHPESTPDIEKLRAGVLKLLFNITLTLPSQADNQSPSQQHNQLPSQPNNHSTSGLKIADDEYVCEDLARTIGYLLMEADVKSVLIGHAINLITNFPPSAFKYLILDADCRGGVEDGGVKNDGENFCGYSNGKPAEINFDARIFSGISKLIAFLKLKLEANNKKESDEISPVLKCLSQACRSHPPIRRFCCREILPRLRDEVMRLPEEGDDLRNRLCSLLTCGSSTLTSLSADLLFVLCKESVSRFVKYTGYGNAAGLLAQRGLMAGGRATAGQYSSSSDSDTEEYKQLKDGVNPVTGRWEEAKGDALADMSEEQKEYEANKLLNQIHQLSSSGLIRPMRVGEDGKPVAVEHVAQLLEENPHSRNFPTK